MNASKRNWFVMVQAAQAALTQEVQEVCLHHHENQKRGINDIFHEIAQYANHNPQSHYDECLFTMVS